MADARDDEGRSSVRGLIAGLLVVVAVGALIAAGVWAMLGPKPVVDAPSDGGFEPAQPTSASPLPGIDTSSPASTDAESRTAGVEPVGGGETGFTRASRIAFRLGGTIYVADESGSAPSTVARSERCRYALSPDGMTLALVEQGELVLFDTASGARIPVSDAADQEPAWLPDSSGLLFVRADTEHHGDVTDVWRVGRDGSGLKKLQQGGSPSVSRDGRIVVVVGLPSVAMDSSFVFVSRDGARFKKLKVRGGIATAAAAEGGVVYAGILDGEGRARIVAVSVDDGEQAELGESSAADVAATWGRLVISPDGSCMAAEAAGDDGFSRVSILSLPGGKKTTVSVRRDGYLRGWSSTGEWLFYIEGNSFQGEATALMRVGCDGVGRRAIVTGAE